MLIQQRKEQEKDGIITRTVYPQVPPRVEYELSDMGIALGPAWLNRTTGRSCVGTR